MRAGTHEKAQLSLVENWNRDFSIGTDVVVTMDDGSKKNMKTQSSAFMLGACGNYPGHTAVIQLDGISGCYALERVRVAVM